MINGAKNYWKELVIGILLMIIGGLGHRVLSNETTNAAQGATILTLCSQIDRIQDNIESIYNEIILLRGEVSGIGARCDGRNER